MNKKGTDTLVQSDHGNNCATMMIDQQERWARRALNLATFALLDVGLSIGELHDSLTMAIDLNGRLDQGKCSEHSLLHYPILKYEPWETCNPYYRATVEDMRLKLEASCSPFSMTHKALYTRWIRSGLSSQMVVAEIKQENGAELTPDEQLMVAVMAHQEHKRKSHRAARDQSM